MSFITDADLQQAILDAIKQLSVETPAAQHIVNIAAPSNTRAYNEIQRRLLTVGYSQAQVDGWDHGGEYQRDLGLYFAFIDVKLNVGTEGETFIKLKDRRDELSTMPFLIVAGAKISRESLTGRVGVGSLDTSQDTFVMNPNDCRRGRVTRW